MRGCSAFLALAVSACIDGTGPRPRPGTIDEEEPPPSGEAVRVLSAELQPRVITQGVTDTVVIAVTLSAAPTAAAVQLRTGPIIPLRRVSGNVYSAKLPASAVLFGYRSGDLHQAAGVIEVNSGGESIEMPLMANVKDGTVPLSSFTTINPTMQASDHVVNIRVDAATPGAPVAASVIRSFYEQYPDDFQFLAVLEAVQSDKAPFYTAVQNNIRGIGASVFDNSGSYGSAGRLEGIIQFPVDAAFDAARTDNIHELAHRWLNHLSHPFVSSARPHWPMSTLAYGIMGLASSTPSAWDVFPFDLVNQPDGTYLVRGADTPRSFNDLELYLLGLLPADSVQPHLVFADQNQRQQLRNNGVLRGRVDTLTIARVVAQAGARIPTAATARRDFRMATIVISRNGLLSRDELAFFDHVTARGEARVMLAYSSGFTRANTLPFYLATGQRATLTTRLRLLQQPL